MMQDEAHASFALCDLYRTNTKLTGNN